MDSGENASIIRLSDVKFTYTGRRGTALFTMTIPRLEFGRGEHIACIGPSGTGKTTLVNLIAGILVPDCGSIELDGTTISEIDESTRRAKRISTIGLVFQEFELLEYLTALDNILLPFHISPSLRLTREVRVRAELLAETMRISHTLRRRPKYLSQGERQRVAICRAMIAQPKVIMADEPTGNLDPDTAAITLDMLFDQARQHEATLVMVTHNHAILPRFDRVIDVMEFAGTRRIPVPAEAG